MYEHFTEEAAKQQQKELRSQSGVESTVIRLAENEWLVVRQDKPAWLIDKE